MNVLARCSVGWMFYIMHLLCIWGFSLSNCTLCLLEKTIQDKSVRMCIVGGIYLGVRLVTGNLFLLLYMGWS